jgi:hypothetical protein
MLLHVGIIWNGRITIIPVSQLERKAAEVGLHIPCYYIAAALPSRAPRSSHCDDRGNCLVHASMRVAASIWSDSLSPFYGRNANASTPIPQTWI